jgi:hypothetical protein
MEEDILKSPPLSIVNASEGRKEKIYSQYQ